MDNSDNSEIEESSSRNSPRYIRRRSTHDLADMAVQEHLNRISSLSNSGGIDILTPINTTSFSDSDYSEYEEDRTLKGCEDEGEQFIEAAKFSRRTILSGETSDNTPRASEAFSSGTFTAVKDNLVRDEKRVSVVSGSSTTSTMSLGRFMVTDENGEVVKEDTFAVPEKRASLQQARETKRLSHISEMKLTHTSSYSGDEDEVQGEKESEDDTFRSPSPINTPPSSPEPEGEIPLDKRSRWHGKVVKIEFLWKYTCSNIINNG